MTPRFEHESLKPSAAERSFDEFLKRHELHHTQSPCGLGWVERNISRSGIYEHSVALDLVEPDLRLVLPNQMGSRSLFRFMIPVEASGNPPHLTTSDQQLYIPGVELKLPRNPNLELDLAALVMLIKSQARRTLEQHEVPVSPAHITLLMALWFGLSAHHADERERNSEKGAVEALDPEMIDWIAAGAPAYLTLLKALRSQQCADLTLADALEAKGIRSHQLAVLYPIEPRRSVA